MSTHDTYQELALSRDTMARVGMEFAREYLRELRWTAEHRELYCLASCLRNFDHAGALIDRLFEERNAESAAKVEA